MRTYDALVTYTHQSELHKIPGDCPFVKIVSHNDKCYGVCVNGRLHEIQLNRKSPCIQRNTTTDYEICDIDVEGDTLSIGHKDFIEQINCTEHSTIDIRGWYVTKLHGKYAVCVNLLSADYKVIDLCSEMITQTDTLLNVEMLAVYPDHIGGLLCCPCAFIAGVLYARTIERFLWKSFEEHKLKQLSCAYLVTPDRILVQIAPYEINNIREQMTVFVNMSTGCIDEFTPMSTVHSARFMSNNNTTFISCENFFFILSREAVDELSTHCSFMSLITSIDSGELHNSMYFAYDSCQPCFSKHEDVVVYIYDNTVWIATTTYPYHLRACKKLSPNQDCSGVYLHYENIICTTSEGDVFIWK